MTTYSPDLAASGRNRVIFLLDASGSMESYAAAARDGYNDFLVRLQQANIQPPVELTLTQFASSARTIIDRCMVDRVLPLNDYAPGGGTLLYDTIGRAVRQLEAPRAGRALATRQLSEEELHMSRLGVLPEQQPDADDSMRTLCVILTDGHDTNSIEFNAAAIRQLVERYEATGTWTFIWLAVGPNAYRPPWIKPGNQIDFAFSWLRDSMRRLAEATVRFLTSDDQQTETFFLIEGRSHGGPQ